MLLDGPVQKGPEQSQNKSRTWLTAYVTTGQSKPYLNVCLSPLPLSHSYDTRYAEVHSGHLTPDPASLPDFEDDDSDPNYARINNFRQPPLPQTFISRTPSPGGPTAGSVLPQASLEELDGLYAKVNKSRPPTAHQSQHQTQTDR